MIDKHILAVQKLFSKQFPHIQGLQPTYLEQKTQFKPIPKSGVQIVNENNQHWACLSTLSSPSHTIDLYDSLKTKKISSHILKQCGLLLCLKKNVIIVRTIQVQQELLPFPKEKETRKTKPQVLSTNQVQIYCTCRFPEDKRQKMVKCVVRLQWFLARCVQIPKDVF